jgi:purine-binding chemotaxis protein CheW
MDNQLVVFELGREHFGIDIAAVESIIKIQVITSVPHTADYIMGVTNLRGSVVPVIDLGICLGLTRKANDGNTRIIVANVHGVKVGMIVDSVSEVMHVADDSIEPPPTMALSLNRAYITGVAKIDEMLVIMLDLGEILQLNKN